MADDGGFFSGRNVGSVLAGAGGALLGGPLGAAAGVGLWNGLYSYAEGKAPTAVAEDAVVSGVEDYAGGKALEVVGGAAVSYVGPRVAKFFGSEVAEAGEMPALTGRPELPALPAPSEYAQEGIYEYRSNTGDIYVGQSGDVPGRVRQPVDAGKLLRADVGTVRTTDVLGGKTAREIAEQRRIIELRGVKNLRNVRNPIGPRRGHLLTQDERCFLDTSDKYGQRGEVRNGHVRPEGRVDGAVVRGNSTLRGGTRCCRA